MNIRSLDKLHEMLVSDAQRRMEAAFKAGNITLAHKWCNEFGLLIQKRSAEMVAFMDRESVYSSCNESRRNGLR